MGLFKKFFRQGQPPAPKANDRVGGIEPPGTITVSFDDVVDLNNEEDRDLLISAIAKEMVASSLGYCEPTPEEIVEQKERERLAEEGRKIRRARIAEQDVAVDLFTDAKTEVDAIEFLDRFSPQWRVLRIGNGEKRINGDFQNLTKTGKLPKNVYVAHFGIDELPSTSNAPIDMVIVHLKYLKDGSVNMFDAHLWRNYVRHGYSVRMVEGEYRITSITSTDMNRELETTLYLDAAPSDAETAIALLDSALEKAWQ